MATHCTEHLTRPVQRLSRDFILKTLRSTKLRFLLPLSLFMRRQSKKWLRRKRLPSNLVSATKRQKSALNAYIARNTVAKKALSAYGWQTNVSKRPWGDGSSSGWLTPNGSALNAKPTCLELAPGYCASSVVTAKIPSRRRFQPPESAVPCRSSSTLARLDQICRGP